MWYAFVQCVKYVVCAYAHTITEPYQCMVLVCACAMCGMCLRKCVAGDCAVHVYVQSVMEQGSDTRSY